MTMKIPRNVPVPTTPVDQPYLVRLEGVATEEGGTITVYDEVCIDGRRIVRSAHSQGFWHVRADAPAVAQAIRTAVPVATFEPHPAASFAFPRR